MTEFTELNRSNDTSSPNLGPTLSRREALLFSLLATYATATGCSRRDPSDTVTSRTQEAKQPEHRAHWREPSLPIYDNIQKMRESGRYSGIEDRLKVTQETPMAIWLGEWIANPQDYVNSICRHANANSAIPTFVIYNIFDRDIGGFSEGGVKNTQEYANYVAKISAGISENEAIIILEPDALPDVVDLRESGKNNEATARVQALRDALRTFGQNNPQTYTYIDTGHSAWLTPDDAAQLLREVDDGQGIVSGISLNVSNFQPTKETEDYASEIESLFGRVLAVTIDVSRNGATPGDPENWCNPTWARVGFRPDATFDSQKRQHLWVKAPGESDGEDPLSCQPGSPEAGEFSPTLLSKLLGE